jgi:hypothetical protein
MHPLLGERDPGHLNPWPFGCVGGTRGNVGAVVGGGCVGSCVGGKSCECGILVCSKCFQ